MDKRPEQKDPPPAAPCRPAAFGPAAGLRPAEAACKAGRRRQRGEGRASALLLAAVLHGLLVLPAGRLATTGEDFLEPALLITLSPEPTLLAPPAPHAAPPGEAPARPEPPVPLKQLLAKPEPAAGQPPGRPPSRKKPQASKSTTSKQDSIDQPAGTLRPQPAGSDAAAASAPPAEGPKDPQQAPADSPPSAIHHPPPDYPQRARARGWQGTVIVEVLVDSAGRVREARLVATSGHEVLDRAALEKVEDWRFRPGRQDGKNSARPVRIPIRFQLKEKSQG